MSSFERTIREHGMELRRAALHTLQINVGRKCNQMCRHCHVEAGPSRTEMMSEETAVQIGAWIRRHRPAVVDITGGAPELSAHFRFFVETARAVGADVIDRNNLTIIETEPFGWLPAYLAANDVEVVASLPCYLEENVDAQRGDGVFERSVRALRKLNAVGYGTCLPLNLIYNPLGPRLPPPQAELEAEYRTELRRRYGIAFTRLYVMTNQPIGRFADDLRQQGRWDEYLELLAARFNPSTVEGLMCRGTLSVGWNGGVYDCDFNQMLGMQLRDHRPLFLWDVSPRQLENRAIATGPHCLACTAGTGSSCTGSLRPSAESPSLP
jgi:radical SAM/Cys-rich protein